MVLNLKFKISVNTLSKRALRNLDISYLPMSQYFPYVPAGHSHLGDPLKLMQVPPLRHL